MEDELELELLLSFDGASYQASEGYVVEFRAGRGNLDRTISGISA
jgi:hypothetical protein